MVDSKHYLNFARGYLNLIKPYANLLSSQELKINLDQLVNPELKVLKDEILQERSFVQQTLNSLYQAFQHNVNKALKNNPNIAEAYLLRANLYNDEYSFKMIDKDITGINSDEEIIYKAFEDYNKHQTISKSKISNFQFTILKTKLLKIRPNNAQGLSIESINKDFVSLITDNPENKELLEFHANFIHSQIKRVIHVYLSSEKELLSKPPTNALFGSGSSLNEVFRDAINTNSLLIGMQKQNKYYWERGLYYFLVGDFNLSNSDFSIVMKNNPKAFHYWEMIVNEIETEKYRRNEQYLNYQNWASNECACGESPCQCSSRDN